MTEVVVIGSGAGGGTLAYALARRGVHVRLFDRGEFVPPEARNRRPEAWLGQGYNATEIREFGDGSRAPRPAFYHVGGQTKFYGAALVRLRDIDFGAIEYPGGTSPPWPISYSELEPYYSEAEQIYRVHGNAREDPT